MGNYLPTILEDRGYHVLSENEKHASDVMIVKTVAGTGIPVIEIKTDPASRAIRQAIMNDPTRKGRMDSFFMNLNHTFLRTFNDLTSDGDTYNEMYTKKQEFIIKRYPGHKLVDHKQLSQKPDVLIGFIAKEDVDVNVSIGGYTVSSYCMKKGDFVYTIDDTFPLIAYRYAFHGIEVHGYEKLDFVCVFVLKELMGEGDFLNPQEIICPINDKEAHVSAYGMYGNTKHFGESRSWREIYPESHATYVMQPFVHVLKD
jgi:hypothetical protein